MRRSRALLFVTSLATLAATPLLGCSSPLRQGEHAVREYNTALVAAYRQSDASLLDPFASAAEVNRVKVLIEWKQSAGLVLESTLESLEVVRVETPTPDTLEVETRERWRYFDRAVRPGVTGRPEVTASMRLHYRFVRQATWQLERVSTLAADEPPKDESTPRTPPTTAATATDHEL